MSDAGTDKRRDVQIARLHIICFEGRGWSTLCCLLRIMIIEGRKDCDDTLNYQFLSFFKKKKSELMAYLYMYW